MHQNLTDRFFVIGMWWRIIYGSLRILLGFAVLKIIGMPLIDVLTKVMSHELIEDPQDLFYSFGNAILGHHPVHVSYFLAVYFIFWGVIDTVLSYQLLKHKLWAFPLSIVLIGVFILYELIRFTYNHSLILLWVIFVDGVITYLIWREYTKLKH